MLDADFQRLLASVPHTPWRAVVVPLVCAAQAVPFHLTMVPPSPTARYCWHWLPTHC